MGKENTLQIDIIRHAQKGSDGELTEEGKVNAFSFVSNLSGTERDVKIYTSDIKRAIDTGDLINTTSKSNYLPRVRDFLSESPYTDERLSELRLDGGKWLYLNEGTADLPDTKVVAGKLAKFILNIHRLRSRIKDPNHFSIVGVTHVPTIMCFMSHLIAHDLGKSAIDAE